MLLFLVLPLRFCEQPNQKTSGCFSSINPSFVNAHDIIFSHYLQRVMILPVSHSNEESDHKNLISQTLQKRAQDGKAMTIQKPAMRFQEDQWARTMLPTPASTTAAFHLPSGSLCDPGLASADSDSFPRSVPWLARQAGSGLHPTCSVCLLSNICPPEDARLGSALGPPRLLCPVR